MIRTATSGELDYVYSTWCHGVINGHRSNTLRTRHLVSQINDALEKARTLVDVTLGTRAEGDVVGWICYSPLRTTGVVHWLYVRKVRRKEGIARTMLGVAGIDMDRIIPYTSDAKAATDLVKDLSNPEAKALRFQHVPLKDVLP